MADDDKPTGDQDKPTGTDGKDWKAEAEKWKALARKHEDQSKANLAELDKLKAASDSSTSDMDKVRAEIAALKQRAEKAERKALVAEVAQAKGLSPAQAKRLAGNSREELEADADELLEAFGGAKPGKGEGADGKPADEGDGSGSGEGIDTRPPESKERKYPAGSRPKEKLTSGAVPATSGDKSPAELAESILKSDF